MFCPIMTREHPHSSPGGGSDDLPTAGASSLAPLSLRPQLSRRYPSRAALTVLSPPTTAVITSPGQRKDTDREILVASVMKYWPRMWFKLTYSGDIKKNFILNFASAQNQVCNTSNQVVQIYIQDFVLVRFVIFSNTDWLCPTSQWKKFWLNFSSVE